MNPAYPTEAVPLHGRERQWTSGESGGPTIIQHTTVNIPSEPPKDHLVWSLFSFVYANFCCLGLVAVLFSVKARDRKVVGDLSGALNYASTARILNIVATVLLALGILLSIISFIVLAVNVNPRYRY